MIVHLGRRVSALLDGQLSPSETERAWQHVHVCHPCRDLVETEGRIKTHLAGLGRDRGAAPSYLKGSLLGDISAMAPSYPEVTPQAAGRTQQRVTIGLIGTGAIGFAMLGAFVFTVPLSQAPSGDRRLPVSDLTATTAPQPTLTPATRAGSPEGVSPSAVRPGISSVSATTPVIQQVRAGYHLSRNATRTVK
jgi:hypothetical protein